MAKWRAIHKSISTSWEVNQLSWMGRTLFTWMCTHADDWGIFSGNLGEIKLKVLPGGDCTLDEIEEQLALMEELGLIRRYHPDGHGPLIWFPSFDDRQPGNVIGKRTEPKRPLHPDDTRSVEIREESPKIPENPRKFTLEQTRAEESRQEETRPEAEQNGAAASEQSYIINLKRGLLKDIKVNNPARKQFAEDPRVTTEGITSLYDDICRRPGIVDVRAVFVSEMREEPR